MDGNFEREKEMDYLQWWCDYVEEDDLMSFSFAKYIVLCFMGQ
jgi:hypothetical protein